MVTTNMANAADTNSTTSDTSTTISALDNSLNALPFGDMGGITMGEQGFGGGRGGHGPGGMGGMRGIGNIEISSEYNATVTAILNSDPDVQNLIGQGYNITSIRPVLTHVIEADGTLTTEATTAIVTLENGTSGHATANLDVSNAKVTQIVIITRTVIDKTTT